MDTETRSDSVAASACPPAESGRVPIFWCDCPGFQHNWPEKFCLRCLEAWVGGLPGVMSGKRLRAEMRRAAGILAARVKEDPEMARLTVKAALQAAETMT